MDVDGLLIALGLAAGVFLGAIGWLWWEITRHGDEWGEP